MDCEDDVDIIDLLIIDSPLDNMYDDIDWLYVEGMSGLNRES